MEWFIGPVAAAISACKQKSGILIVYVRDDGSDSAEMDNVVATAEIASSLSGRPYTAMKIVKDSLEFSQFASIYPVVVVPSVYFIQSQTGFPLQIIKGRTTAEDLAGKVSQVFETLGQMASAQAVSTSAEAATVPVSSQPGSPSHDEGAVTDPGPAEGGKKLEDRVRDTEALIARRRQQKLQEEQERSKLKEAQRRFEGKGMVEAKRTHKEQANQLWIQERVKQKEEERRARADILAKLEQDKEERRKARQSTAPQQGGASSTGHSVVRQRVAVSAASSTSPTSKTRLQFRLPQGGSVVQQFGSSSTLRDAREFIVEHLQCQPSQIVLSGTFPSRVLSEDDDDQTLVELGLAPSSVILVRSLRKPLSAGSSGSGGVLGSIVAALMWLVSLVVTLFKSLGSLLPSSAPPGSNSQSPPSQGKPHEGRFAGRNQSSGSRFRHVKQNDGEEDEDSDERRKTDNGNSTQQQ